MSATVESGQAVVLMDISIIWQILLSLVLLLGAFWCTISFV
jgi:hypothetical protein